MTSRIRKKMAATIASFAYDIKKSHLRIVVKCVNSSYVICNTYSNKITHLLT